MAKKPGRKRPRKVRKLKPIFEGRRRAPEEHPEGFDINLGSVSQDEAYATIKARLEDAQASLPEGIEGRIILHPYADGSVDGELYIKVPEGDHQGDTAWDLHRALGEAGLGRQYWISLGTRYVIEADDEIYRRFRGLNQVQTNYQRATATNIAEEDLVLRKEVLPGMRDRFKREAHSIFVRLHWNPENKQPKR